MSEYEYRLSAKLSSYRAPDALLDALDRSEQPDPAVGQMWRAHVEGTALLVLLLDEFASGSLEVVVATPGETPPVGSAVEHVVARTDTYQRLTVWPGLRGPLHQRVLDVLIEDSAATQALSTTLRTRPRAEAPVDVLDPGAELLAELGDDLHTLQDAPAVPVRPKNPAKLSSLLPGEPGAQLTLLIESLELGQPIAMELLRSKRELTDAQARSLEQRLGLANGTLPAAGGLEPALVAEVEHPRWRSAARTRARRQGVPEVEARTSLAAEAYALAARESTSTPDWRQRLSIIVAGES
ncbi:hypothetical protein [Aquipuribacter hungaricus]|uniref:Uncharacterized protein n=1 Tax=Aquipuribacter hungaricus TaxID=545624 RepID=A0ABV7WHB8_9MICO